jgi:hypothetical protein
VKVGLSPEIEDRRRTLEAVDLRRTVPDVPPALVIQRIGSSKALFTPLGVHDVYSRGEIRDLDGKPGPVSGFIRY